MGSPHPQKRPSEGWLWPSALKRIFKLYTEWFGKDLNSCKKVTGKNRENMYLDKVTKW